MVGWQGKCLNSRRSRMAKAETFCAWWQPSNSFRFETLSFLPLWVGYDPTVSLHGVDSLTDLKIIDYLDTMLDLTLGLFKPYSKTNYIAWHIIAKSNHPPTILKRILSNSCNEQVFNAAAPIYKDFMIDVDILKTHVGEKKVNKWKKK